MLQREIAKGLKGTEQTEFVGKNLAEIQKYLKTDDGKEAATKVMSAPALQRKMHKIESAGYQAVHAKFKDNFKDIAWEAPKSTLVRSTNITNSKGQQACVLKETTVKTTPTSLDLADGTSNSVKSYRQIEFPKTLKADHGPLHVSMALKDETGKNMPEKNAVYFTAHYDDSGKLTEVSSPIPVKFMGDKKNAIGYIEREGKVYTLPVTQGKYQEMMQEVAKNNGMNIDLTQKEQLASDKVLTVEVQKVKAKLKATTKTTATTRTPKQTPSTTRPRSRTR
jgi:hypothetical protein